MRHTLLGVLGTLGTITLEQYNMLAAAAAGTLTAAWMARQLWLSFQKKR